MPFLPTSSEYKEGYQLAIDNAKSLSRIAELSAGKNEFGIACSLSILAAEESIKAIILYVKHMNIQADIDELDKLFKEHKIKHQLYSETLDLFQAIIEIFYTKGGLYSYFIDIINQTVPESELPAFLEESKAGLEFLKKLSTINDASEEIINKDEIDKTGLDKAKAWWSKANLLKNRGFYVDRIETGWHSPHNLTTDIFRETRKNTHFIIDNADRIISFLSKKGASRDA